MRIFLVTAGLFSLAGLNVARAEEAQCAGAAHLQHTITVNRDATCVLSKLFEPNAFCLTIGESGEASSVPFAVTVGAAATFQMTFNAQADFNMVYALTCVAQDGALARSPKVIFTIGANGPGDPDISALARYGAVGTWNAAGDRVDFVAHF